MKLVVGEEIESGDSCYTHAWCTCVPTIPNKWMDKKIEGTLVLDEQTYDFFGEVHDNESFDMGILQYRYNKGDIFNLETVSIYDIQKSSFKPFIRNDDIMRDFDVDNFPSVVQIGINSFSPFAVLNSADPNVNQDTDRLKLHFPTIAIELTDHPEDFEFKDA